VLVTFGNRVHLHVASDAATLSGTGTLVLPPVPLTAEGDNVVAAQAYGNGTYTPAASGPNSNSYFAFDGSANTYADLSESTVPSIVDGQVVYTNTVVYDSSGAYTGATSTYVNSVDSSFTTGLVAGEYLQLDLPSATLTSYSITCVDAASAPRTFMLVGGTDRQGTNYIIDRQTDVTWTTGQTRTFTITTPLAAYVRVLLVVTASRSASVKVASMSVFRGTAYPCSLAISGDASVVGDTSLANLTTSGNTSLGGDVYINGNLDSTTTLAGPNINETAGAVTLPNHICLLWGSDTFVADSLNANTVAARMVPFAYSHVHAN
jgi:hypothetical protein